MSAAVTPSSADFILHPTRPTMITILPAHVRDHPARVKTMIDVRPKRSLQSGSCSRKPSFRTHLEAW